MSLQQVKPLSLLYKFNLSRCFWFAVVIFAALMILIPMASIAFKAFTAQSNIWPHLSRTLLPTYISETFTLMFGIGVCVIFLGVGSAIIVSRFDFVGRKSIEWLLILPLAIPTYLVAYVYTDLLEYAGPVQKVIRQLFGYNNASDYPFFEIRSMTGAILTMALVLYPYVYLLARAAFLEQSVNLMDTARMLGRGRIYNFIHVVLPLARPAIIVGLTLVIMEVLNDYGAVHHFTLHTFSEGIYDYWLGRANIAGASQIAMMLLVIIILLITVEQLSRRRQAQYQNAKGGGIPRIPLSGKKALVVTLFCLVPIIFGFAVPMARLLYFSVQYFAEVRDSRLWQMAFNSISISMTAALATVLLALFVAYARRLVDSRFIHTMGITSGLGYAMPGAVLAIGVIVPFGLLDNWLDDLFIRYFDIKLGLLFSGTVFIVIFAYMIRFLAIAQGTLYASLSKITPSMDYSARTLGCNNFQIIKRVHLPLINKGVLTAALIVFVDSMKELPATLILRPFNFDTLATHVFQYASDGLLEETSLAAVLIILVGLVPVIFLNKSISDKG